jgi:hypothetical protein
MTNGGAVMSVIDSALGALTTAEALQCTPAVHPL